MVLSDVTSGDAPWRKWFITCWAFVECLLFGGILYGWASLVFVFKDEAIYADGCRFESATSRLHIHGGNWTNVTYGIVTTPSDVVTSWFENATTNFNKTNVTQTGVVRKPSCRSQDDMFALCFTIGSTLFCASAVFMGQLNYKCGTRVTRITAFCLFIAGSLMLAFVSTETPWLIFPGLTIIGIGGLPVLVTNIQVSNLFTTGASSVVGLLIGGYDMSSAVFLLVKIAHQHGFSRRYMYILLAGIHSMTLVSTFCFLPRGFIQAPADKEMKQETEEAIGPIKGDIILHDGKEGAAATLFEGDQKKRPEPRPTLRSCVLQPLYIIHVTWVCLLQLRFFYFIGMLNPYLTRTLDGDVDLVSYFTNVFFYTMMGGLLSSFFAGIVYDWQKRLFRGGESGVYRALMPAVLPLCVASVMATALSVLVLVPGRDLLYPIFVVMVLYRSFLYSVATAFLNVIFPSEYFGLLYGIMIISAGVFGTLQYGLFTWSEAGINGPQQTDICLLCVAILSFCHPGYLWLRSRRAERGSRV